MTPTVGGDIDENWFSANYDPTVQAALASSDNTFVIIDLVSADIVNVEHATLTRHASTTMLAGTAPSLVREGLPTISLHPSGRSSQRSMAPMSE